jgi:tetratricopeptide (TPR) repeat protein
LCEWCCSALGLPGRAAHADRAESLLLELDDSLGLGNLYLNRGLSAWTEARAREAIEDFTMASERYERAGYVLGAALADNNVAEVRTLQMRLDEAQRLLVHARRVIEAANYPIGTFIAVSGLSRVAAWRGDTAAARSLQHEALAGFAALGADDFVADSRVRLVEIAVAERDWAGALLAAEEAGAALNGLGEVPVLPGMLCRLRGRALEGLGRIEDAREEYARAVELSDADGFAYETALASIGLARVDGDEAAAARGEARLRDIDVVALPPGT